VGFKVTAGQVTDQPAVIVYVRRKLALSSLGTAQIIPTTLGDVPTDVIEAGDVMALGSNRSVEIHSQRHRPVVGGISCGPSRFVMAGTVGLPLVFREGVAGLLSNKHVISPTWMTASSPLFKWKGVPIRQPSALDGGTEGDAVAEVQDLVPIVAGQDNEVDADFARYINGQDARAALLGLGAYTALGDPEPGMVVAKSGRTSGVSEGRRILSVGTRMTISYPVLGEVSFVDQVVTEPMLLPGDSGSAIVSGETVIALGFAGSEAISVANPIRKVFELLGLSLVGPAPPAAQPVPVAQGLQSLLRQGALQVAWGFDARSQRFLLFDPANPVLSDLVLLEPGKGYWLRLSRNTQFTYQGGNVPLYEGWNLVGWPVA
jgi:hypothetical protein